MYQCTQNAKRRNCFSWPRAQDEAARRELESLPARAFVAPADAARLAPSARAAEPPSPGSRPAEGLRCALRARGALWAERA